MLTLSHAVNEIAEVVSAQCPIVDGKLNEDVVRRINEAGEQLVSLDDWPDTLHSYAFNTKNHCISLPIDITAIRHATICGKPADVRSVYFEYIGHPSAYRPGVDCHPRLEFKGKHATLQDYDQAQHIVAITDRVEDEDAKVVITGLDNSNLPVREDCSIGESMPIDKCEPYYTKSWFSTVQSITKPATCGVVWVYTYNPETQALEIPLATLMPGETHAEYKRYWVPGIHQDEEACVHALVKMGWHRHYTDPSDILPLDNVFALKSMVKAMVFHRNNDLSGYDAYRTAALNALQVQSANESMGQEPEIKKKFQNRFTSKINRYARRHGYGRRGPR